ncbi:legumain-like [Paramacrobiotus metropolitanus]|uniref:legumain-like n=1 Tax=Paramacrobiotus metropolitanus TaxID=2943436 RepID=UPI0024457D99|nr:legumain-like [Paramacrobiotus metropolitanus]
MLRILTILLLAATAFAVILPASSKKNRDKAEDAPNIWVLIVAGSNGYYNYRHQSDACHAYHIMAKHGIPDSNIVVMQYDDIANDPENPTPGIIINHPNGSDVYKGALKDYTGDTVTSTNFLKILQGDAAAMKGIGSGKVINSGPNDHVFVNFVDHGAPGIVAFPNDELSAVDLNNAIKDMHKQKKFAKMVLYFEACESGSMFDGILPNNIDVFATTAANPDESSYACYYDDLRQTYLGDVYSVNWMEDSDKENLSKETLQSQFKIVKKETNTSHVMEYGDLTIAQMKVGDFMGHSFDEDAVQLPKVSKADAVKSEDVYLTILRKKAEKSQTPEESDYWMKQVHAATAKRGFINGVLRKLAGTVAKSSSHALELINTRQSIDDEEVHQCLHLANKFFSKNCFSLARNEYALFTAPRFLANACADGISAAELIRAMRKTCTHQTMHGIN